MILNNNELPLPLLSIIGYIAALIIRPKNKTNLKLLLAFSGSFHAFLNGYAFIT
jgi:hypothetical protein